MIQWNRGRAHEDQDEAHHEGAQDAPLEDPGLVVGPDLEILEDHDEDEHVVDRERLLDHVARQELDRVVDRQVEGDPRAEEKRHPHPHHAPDGGLLHRDRVVVLAGQEQVDVQHRRDDDVENDPHHELVAHGVSLSV
jgi:hypothetical protein